jgi:hypothetical protein
MPKTRRTPAAPPQEIEQINKPDIRARVEHLSALLADDLLPEDAKSDLCESIRGQAEILINAMDCPPAAVCRLYEVLHVLNAAGFLHDPFAPDDAPERA